METKLDLLTKLQAKNCQRHFEMYNRHCGESKQTSKVPDVNEVCLFSVWFRKLFHLSKRLIVSCMQRRWQINGIGFWSSGGVTRVKPKELLEKSTQCHLFHIIHIYHSNTYTRRICKERHRQQAGKQADGRTY
jgi:hypothetical protein